MASCTRCGATADADDQFCRECGTSLEPSQSGAEAPAGADGTAGDNGKAKPASGRLGFWALGLVLGPAALGWLSSFLPGRLEAGLAAVTMSLITLGGILGGVLALLAVFRQRGALNRLAGLAVLGLLGYLIMATGDMDQTKERRFIVVQGMTAAAPARMAVAEAFAATGRLPDSNADVALGPLSSEHERLIDAVNVGPGGVVTVQFAVGLNGPISGKTLVQHPVATAEGVTWECRGGTVPPDYLPPACR